MDKFSKDKDIPVFAKEVEEHMKDHGMDTVMYAQDPASSNKVVSVLTEHGKFEVKEGVKSGMNVREDVRSNTVLIKLSNELSP